jgi:NADPH:quinone reductase-like Zn-dependent oxidoreductase
MRAITIMKKGSPEVLELREYPSPIPADGEVRVSVRAAGLNFAEIAARQGLYPDAPPMPCVVGYEVAGIVDAVGSGVVDLAVGDRVFALTRFGGHAEEIVVPEIQVLKMPDRMSFAEGAAIPVNYLTAHHMLFHIGRVHPGSSILLHMAAGGVGTAVLQLLATVDDLTIFGTASAPKHDYLRDLGCTHPIDYRTQKYEDVVREVTDGRGVDIVLDPLGGKDWRTGIRLLAPAGRLVAFGFANMISGPKANLFRVISQILRVPRITPLRAMEDNISVQGVNMGHLWQEVGMLRLQLDRLLELYNEGIVRPHIHAEVPFAEVASAHTMLESGANRGKVVLVP